MEIDCVMECERLKKYLAEARSKFGKWNETLLKQLGNTVSQHETSIQTCKEKTSKHKDNIENLKEEISNQTQALESKLEKLERLKLELEQARDLQKILQVTQEQERNNVDQLSKEIERTKEDVAKETSAKQKLNSLEAECAKFQEYLGLTLKKTKGNRIQFIFTHIDENDPESVSYFFCTISKDRSYVASDPEPPIEGLDELVEKLNKTNNISAFVVAMRKKFKAKVSGKTNEKY